MKKTSLLLAVILISLSFTSSAQKSKNSDPLPCIKDGYFLGSMSEASCKDAEGLTVKGWNGY